MDQEAKRFVDACIEENIFLAGITEKENVTDEYAAKAEVIINNMDILGVGDALLFAASLNLLNTYVKLGDYQKNAAGYSFKRKVDKLLKYTVENPSEMIKAEVQQESGMSLAMVEINSIQFSFHQIVLNQDNRKLIAKNLNDPELKWDGIRKQLCSVSLFEFAFNNSYDRAYKMQDGSDFREGFNTIMDEYHKGIINLTDTKKARYNKKDAEQYSILKNGVEDYRESGQAVVILYRSDATTFLHDVKHHLVVPEMVTIYEKTGRSDINEEIKGLWDKALTRLSEALNSTTVNPDAGIQVKYRTATTAPAIEVDIVSRNGTAFDYVTSIAMIPWTKMGLINRDTVEYSIDNLIERAYCIHPSRSVQIIGQAENKGLFNNNKYQLKSCVFCYNATLNSDTDIVTYYEKTDLQRVPVIYANEIDNLSDYISNAASCDGGIELMLEMEKLMHEYDVSSGGALPIEHQNIIRKVVGNLWNPMRNLTVIESSKAKYCTSFEDELETQLQRTGIEYSIYGTEGVKDKVSENANVLIYSGIIPDNIDFMSTPRCIVIIDKNRFTEEMLVTWDRFLENTHEAGAEIERYWTLSPIGYADRGNGVSWIMRILHIGNEPSMVWMPEEYPISILSVDETYEDNDFSQIFVGGDYKIDLFNNAIYASHDNKIRVYEQLIAGKTGAQIKVEDVALRTYMNDCMEIDKDRINEVIISHTESEG